MVLHVRPQPRSARHMSQASIFAYFGVALMLVVISSPGHCDLSIALRGVVKSHMVAAGSYVEAVLGSDSLGLDKERQRKWGR